MRRDTRRARNPACLTAGVAVAIVAGVVGGPGNARADEPSVAVAGVVPAEVRLRRMPRLVQEIVAELDGRTRPGVLWRQLARANEAGGVLRLALSLQAIVRDRNGNYLCKLYLVLADDDAGRAIAFAEQLGKGGIAVGPNSGHFTSLAHMDASEPAPARIVDERIRKLSWGRHVDRFVAARYELSYNKERRGWLSRYLQLTYRDGTRLDIDIRLISDNYEPAPDHAVKYAYLGPGNRIYPLRMGPDTTPRLWAAKHGIALAAMRRSNEQFEEFLGIATTGVMSTLPLGLMAPVYPIPPPRLVVPRVVTPGSSGAAGARSTASPSRGGAPAANTPAARNALPRSGPIPRSLGAASRAEMIAKRVGLNIKSPISRQVLNSLDTPVTEFITRFRKASIRRKFPSEFLQEGVTIEQALLEGGSTVRKLLTNRRFVK